MTAPLAPCPGCGQTDHAHICYGHGYVVRCDCGWISPLAVTAEEARAQWNRRATAGPIPEPEADVK